MKAVVPMGNILIQPNSRVPRAAYGEDIIYPWIYRRIVARESTGLGPKLNPTNDSVTQTNTGWGKEATVR
jgi:hypothetical protein